MDQKIVYSIAEKLLLISVLNACGFDILKRCGEEFRVAVHFMNVDDVDVEVEQNFS